MLAGLAWLAEGCLEAAGAWVFWRRRISILWIWLLVRATADLANFLIRLIAGQQAYVFADYIQRNAQYVFLAAVCVCCVGQILRERPKVRKIHQAGLCAVALAGIVLLHAKWPPSADVVLLFEAGAEIFLAGFIVLALAMADIAPRPWGWIAGALLVLTLSDAAVTMLAWRDWAITHTWANWQFWASWYPAGAIPALAMLAWAGWRDYQHEKRLAGWRAIEGPIDLGKKLPTSHFLCGSEHRRVI